MVHYGLVSGGDVAGQGMKGVNSTTGPLRLRLMETGPVVTSTIALLGDSAPGDINEAIWEGLDALNRRPMQQLGVSRRELYEQLDRPALKPLPSERYQMAEWRPCRVSIDYHVAVDKNYYSVPYQLIGELLEARFTPTIVEIYFKSRRVASHRRLSGLGRG